jgi:CRP-like cAMP-binding protein
VIFQENGSRAIHLEEVRDLEGKPVPLTPAVRAKLDPLITTMRKEAHCGSTPQCPAPVRDRAKECGVTQTSLRDVVRAVPFFEGITNGHLDELARTATIQYVDKKRMLFHENDPCRGFFYVLRGIVKIYRTNVQGRPFTMLAVQPGEVFGEVAALENRPYVGNAQAITPVAVLQVEAATFRKLVEEDFDFAKRVLKTMAIRNRHLQVASSALATGQATARIARYLDEIRTQASDVLRLKLPKAEIAAVLGITPETLSRGLRQLADEEIISVQGSGVKIHDQEALHELGLCC